MELRPSRCSRVSTDRAIRQITDAKERHSRMIGIAMTKAAQRLIGNEEAKVNAVDMNDVGYRELVAAIGELTKLERLVLGEPETHDRTELSGPAGGPVQVQPVEPAAAPKIASVIRVLEEAGVVTINEGISEPGAEEEIVAQAES